MNASDKNQVVLLHTGWREGEDWEQAECGLKKPGRKHSHNWEKSSIRSVPISSEQVIQTVATP